MRRRLIWAAVAMGVLAAVVSSALFLARVRAPQPPAPQIGGAFRLTDQDGRAVTDRDLLGKPTAIFFGFTYCPEVCPTTLAKLTRWLAALGPDADRLNVAFVSIDPDRDTPKQLRLYLSSFDRRIRGLTGSPQAVAAAARAYKVYYRKVPLPGGDYTMDHSAAIYLMDAKGRFVAPINYQMPDAAAFAQLQRLARGEPAAGPAAPLSR